MLAISKSHHELIELNGSKGAFELVVRDADDRLNQMPAKRVVLATGAYDRPNLAGVPGEEDATVRHYFHDWELRRGC